MLFKVQCSGMTKVVVNISMALRVERRYNQAASIFKGYTAISVNDRAVRYSYI